MNKNQSNYNNNEININSINFNSNNNKKQCPICTKYFNNNEIADHMYAHEVEDNFGKSFNNISLIKKEDNADDKRKKEIIKNKMEELKNIYLEAQKIVIEKFEENERRKKYDENYLNKLDELYKNFSEIESFILEQNKNLNNKILEEKEITIQKLELLSDELHVLEQETKEIENKKVKILNRVNKLSLISKELNKEKEVEDKKKLEEQKKKEEEIKKTLEDLKKFALLDDEEKRKIEEKMRDDLRKNNSIYAQDIINRLSENKITDLNKLNKESKDCRIYLERFKINDTVMYLPCFHFFHKKCLENWLEKDLFCPLCKIDIKSNL